MKEYRDFIARKSAIAPVAGFAPSNIKASLFAYQRAVANWAINQGRAALFLDTGLGKTICQMEWLRQCGEHTNAPTLLLTPLAVARQHEKEANKFGYNARVIRKESEVKPGINITNYHCLEDLNPSTFGAVSLDESSILKSFTGSTKRDLCAAFESTPYKLAATATPAPNDYMELGNHSEFLGIMSGSEMLSRWFIVDTMDLGKYRLKKHAVESFWGWVSSWAVCAMHPSDLGYPEEDFQLPALNIVTEEIEDPHDCESNGALFSDIAVSATELGQIKRRTLKERVDCVAAIARSINGPVLVWCQTNDESQSLCDAIEGAVQVVGSESPDAKEEKLIGFADGRYRILITKPSIAGFGLNWQHCADVIFASVNYSYEQFYQAVRRCWRFGQTRPVNVRIVAAASESRLVETLARKKDDHEAMKVFMRNANFARREGLIESVKKRYAGREPVAIPAFLDAHKCA